MFCCWLVTYRQNGTHTHIRPLSDISFRSAYHPHVGEKICSCYRSFLSAVHKRETPVCPRPPCVLNGLANASSVQSIQRQLQEATYQICENCHTLQAILSSADERSPSLYVQYCSPLYRCLALTQHADWLVCK